VEVFCSGFRGFVLSLVVLVCLCIFDGPMGLWMGLDVLFFVICCKLFWLFYFVFIVRWCVWGCKLLCLVGCFFRVCVFLFLLFCSGFGVFSCMGCVVGLWGVGSVVFSGLRVFDF